MRNKKHFTPKEWGILSLLKSNPNKLFTAEEIYKNVWEGEPFNCDGIIAVHLRHIREKIEDDPSKPILIKSIWKKGYCYIGE